ncbi:cyclic nucleotide-binding domain-containing protein [bacterium]|nr:cyclic nucleotide-binding domain-containing protein [bacterium]
MTEELNIEKCVRNLKDVRLFCDLDEAQLTEVARLCELMWMEKRDYVIREGAEARGFYILLKGEVSISKKLELPHLEHVDTEERILTTITAEHHPPLGEAALVGQTERNATVRCASDCALYRIDSAALRDLMQRDQVIGYHIFQRLAEMLYARLEGADGDVIKLTAALIYALEE